MIDLHCHILPGVDDGPSHMDEALAIARIAVSEGVHTIVATPHHGNGVYDNFPESILAGCNEINFELEKKNINLTVLPGAEIRISSETLQAVKNREVMTIAHSGKLVLLELPNMFIVEGVVMMIRELYEFGVTSIIAHPERNPVIISQPQIIDQLRYAGALTQITASSLVGDFGRECKRLAEKLLLDGAVDIISSDMHPGRKYRMKKAAQRAAKLVGQNSAANILSKCEEFVRNKQINGLTLDQI